MCTFDGRVEGGWEGFEKSPEEALLVTFSQECAHLWGYSLGFLLSCQKGRKRASQGPEPPLNGKEEDVWDTLVYRGF